VAAGTVVALTTPRIFLGVDAGNSKTVALVCRASGEVVGAGRSGCGDIYGVADESEAVEAVFAAVDAALGEAGVDHCDVSAAAFRLAGVDWPEDRGFWDTTLTARWPDLAQRSIANDGYAAIRCGDPSGVGVSVMAGTAAAIAARGPAGAEWEMGFWGQHAMGALGLMDEALKAVYLAELGAGPATALEAALLDYYRLPSVVELNHLFTRRHHRASHVDRMRGARVVTGVAAQGDSVARDIVDEQGRRLAMYARIAAGKVGLLERPGSVPVVLSGSVPVVPSGSVPVVPSGSVPVVPSGSVPVVLSGSVLTAQASPVTAALIEHLRMSMPGATVHSATLPPVGGAALDALAEGGVELTRAVVDRLAARVPTRHFFNT
jgi:N-acetylglucosamine kinase-like BadF-type ATPase